MDRQEQRALLGAYAMAAVKGWMEDDPRDEFSFSVREPERGAVLAELKEVVEAKTERSAGKAIWHWGCWDRKCTATKFAARVREEYRKLKEQAAVDLVRRT